MCNFGTKRHNKQHNTSILFDGPLGSYHLVFGGGQVNLLSAQLFMTVIFRCIFFFMMMMMMISKHSFFRAMPGQNIYFAYFSNML